MKLNNNKLGDGGFYTIFIFLALVISALIIGQTILTAASRNSNNAIKTARDATTGTGETINPIKVSAVIENHLVKYIILDAKLGSGQKPILYQDLKIAVFEQNNSTILNYDNSSNNCNGISYGGQKIFRVEPILNGEFYSRNILNKEDIIKICFSTISPLTELDEFDIIIAPNDGAKTTLSLAIPILYNDEEVKIYP
jgi:archaellin